MIGPSADLSIKIKESHGFWLQIAVAPLVFTVLGVLMGMDFSEISPLSIRTVFNAVWAKGLLGLGQAAVLFWMFRLVGTKFL